MLQHPGPQTWIYESRENHNPYASRGVLDFLRTRLALVSPAAARRELENETVDDGDELLPAGLIESAVDDRLGELPSSAHPAFAFLDLSRKRDLTSLVVIVREDPRRPEATDHLVAASVQTWDPKSSPTSETDFAAVRAALARLPERLPALAVLSVDEGAEAGTVLPFCRQHPRLSLLVQGFTANVASNMDLWSALVGRLNAGTLSIPRHERLLGELRGLRKQEFAFGSKYRVVDGSRRLHRDVSLALAGAVLAAGAVEACEVCGASDCGGWHMLPYAGPFFGSLAWRNGEAEVVADDDEPAPLRSFEADGHPTLSPLAHAAGFAAAVRGTASEMVDRAIVQPVKRVRTRLAAEVTDAKAIAADVGAAGHRFVTTFKATGPNASEQTLEEYRRLQDEARRRASAKQIEDEIRRTSWWRPPQ